jgi:L-serine dehydratase
LRPRTALPRHPNALRFRALRSDGAQLLEQTYYSIGGGFVVTDAVTRRQPSGPGLPFPFTTAAELLALCASERRPIDELVLANELVLRDEQTVRSGLLHIWHTMRGCIDAGFAATGELPGRLGVRRRAADIRRRLLERGPVGVPALAMDWLSVAAMAVNEQNAAGGRVVTAPTNGAAGVLPSVLFYALSQLPGLDAADAVVRFLLTATAIAVLIKENASISGAEVGCQGEVGSACAMAAAGLASLRGGTPAQIENAAEIALEHNLGLTCDPVGGLVQIPCIERNGVAAVKAVNAASLALHGDGTHRVSLDQAIATLRETGANMSAKYKETSTGGLAVNVVEC